MALYDAQDYYNVVGGVVTDRNGVAVPAAGNAPTQITAAVRGNQTISTNSSINTAGTYHIADSNFTLDNTNSRLGFPDNPNDNGLHISFWNCTFTINLATTANSQSCLGIFQNASSPASRYASDSRRSFNFYNCEIVINSDGQYRILCTDFVNSTIRVGPSGSIPLLLLTDGSRCEHSKLVSDLSLTTEYITLGSYNSPAVISRTPLVSAVAETPNGVAGPAVFNNINFPNPNQSKFYIIAGSDGNELDPSATKLVRNANNFVFAVGFYKTVNTAATMNQTHPFLARLGLSGGRTPRGVDNLYEGRGIANFHGFDRTFYNDSLQTMPQSGINFYAASNIDLSSVNAAHTGAGNLYNRINALGQSGTALNVTNHFVSDTNGRLVTKRYSLDGGSTWINGFYDFGRFETQTTTGSANTFTTQVEGPSGGITTNTPIQNTAVVPIQIVNLTGYVSDVLNFQADAKGIPNLGGIFDSRSYRFGTDVEDVVGFFETTFGNFGLVETVSQGKSLLANTVIRPNNIGNDDDDFGWVNTRFSNSDVTPNDIHDAFRLNWSQFEYHAPPQVFNNTASIKSVPDTELRTNAAKRTVSLDVTHTLGYPSSGSLIVTDTHGNDHEITYTGKTLNTFTGIPSAGTGSLDINHISVLDNTADLQDQVFQADGSGVSGGAATFRLGFSGSNFADRNANINENDGFFGWNDITYANPASAAYQLNGTHLVTSTGTNANLRAVIATLVGEFYLFLKISDTNYAVLRCVRLSTDLVSVNDRILAIGNGFGSDTQTIEFSAAETLDALEGITVNDALVAGDNIRFGTADSVGNKMSLTLERAKTGNNLSRIEINSTRDRMTVRAPNVRKQAADTIQGLALHDFDMDGGDYDGSYLYVDRTISDPKSYATAQADIDTNFSFKNALIDGVVEVPARSDGADPVVIFSNCTTAVAGNALPQTGQIARGLTINRASGNTATVYVEGGITGATLGTGVTQLTSLNVTLTPGTTGTRLSAFKQVGTDWILVWTKENVTGTLQAISNADSELESGRTLDGTIRVVASGPGIPLQTSASLNVIAGNTLDVDISSDALNLRPSTGLTATQINQVEFFFNDPPAAAAKGEANDAGVGIFANTGKAQVGVYVTPDTSVSDGDVTFAFTNAGTLAAVHDRLYNQTAYQRWTLLNSSNETAVSQDNTNSFLVVDPNQFEFVPAYSADVFLGYVETNTGAALTGTGQFEYRPGGAGTDPVYYPIVRYAQAKSVLSNQDVRSAVDEGLTAYDAATAAELSQARNVILGNLD